MTVDTLDIIRFPYALYEQGRFGGVGFKITIGMFFEFQEVRPSYAYVKKSLIRMLPLSSKTVEEQCWMER